MPDELKRVLADLGTKAATSPRALELAWVGCPDDVKRERVEVYRAFGRRAIALGQPVSAFDVVHEGLERFTDDVELGYLSALALCRGGSTGAAHAIVVDLLTRIDSEHDRYVEVISLSGRISKDYWDHLPDGERRAKTGSRAVACYAEAYAKSGDVFPGINAATMCMLTGDEAEARRLAAAVRTTCLTDDDGGYWTAATLGEACLLLEEFDEAAKWYGIAVTRSGGAIGDVASMRLQVRRLGEKLTVPATVQNVLSSGQVVACAGHMIDTPGREVERFPARLGGAVKDALSTWLAAHDASFGYSSAANGTDLLFAECMLERGAEIHITLPFCREDFVQASVAPGGAHWIERFDHVLASATSVSYATQEDYLGHDALFRYTSDCVCGEALLRGDRLGVPVTLLTVLDEHSQGGEGGTAMTLDTWGQNRSRATIDLAALRGSVGGRTPIVPPPPDPAASNDISLVRRVHTMLFADVKGFSKLSERQSPAFFGGVLGRIAEVLGDGMGLC